MPNEYGWMSRLTRREFLRGFTLMGLLVLLAAVFSACFRKTELAPEPSSPAVPSGLSAPVKEGVMATKVSLVRTTNRAEGVKQSIALLKDNPVRGKAVVLKPNFNSADVTPGSTHIDTLRALVLNLKEMGAKSITLAERSGPGMPTKDVMEKKGIFELAKELDFNVINLEEAGPEAWVHIRPNDSHWKDGFLFPRVISEAESVVEARV